MKTMDNSQYFISLCFRLGIDKHFKIQNNKFLSLFFEIRNRFLQSSTFRKSKRTNFVHFSLMRVPRFYQSRTKHTSRTAETCLKQKQQKYDFQVVKKV